MSKHTPGPWSFRGTLGPHSTPSLRGPCVVEVAATGAQLAIMSGWRTEQQKENARLMAAAPDLLAALQGMVAAMNSDELLPNVPIGMYPSERAAKAAIAKATGEVL